MAVLKCVGNLFGLTLPAAISLLGQPHFDVASIKNHKGEVKMSQGATIRGRTVTAAAIRLVDLITYAYGVRYDQVTGGPAWTLDDRFDLAAKAEGEGALNDAEARPMVRALLADRFQLKTHSEMVVSPVWELTVAKTGVKVQPSLPGQHGFSARGTSKGQQLEADITMDVLARQLSGTAGRPVLDKTGLTGPYHVLLEWYPADQIPPSDLQATSMFVAVQEQLGLKLESARAPVEKLVIDSAQKPGGS
jgi:uncharacterized protein (TIGR03435 family)